MLAEFLNCLDRTALHTSVLYDDTWWMNADNAQGMV